MKNLRRKPRVKKIQTSSSHSIIITTTITTTGIGTIITITGTTITIITGTTTIITIITIETAGLAERFMLGWNHPSDGE